MSADFLEQHPGGAQIILDCAGYDATEDYESVHPPDLILEALPPSACLGLVDQSTVAKRNIEVPPSMSNVVEPEEAQSNVIINVNDFEKAAERLSKPQAWAFFASAADDEISKHWNARDFSKIALRPRVLRDVGTVDTSTSILGIPTRMPLFVSPCGMNKMAHPNGECEIATAVGKAGIIQVVSTVSSQPIEKIMAARSGQDQPIFFQLYVNKDTKKTKALLKKVKNAGVSSIWVTVDSPVLGKRERDEKLKAPANVSSREHSVTYSADNLTGFFHELHRTREWTKRSG